MQYSNNFVLRKKKKKKKKKLRISQWKLKVDIEHYLLL
jgi:hypothetical protein